MQRNDRRLRIQDMLDAVAEILAFTAGLGLEGFQEDAKTLRAVEYDVVVLGEAARGIPQDVPARFAFLPWSRMIGPRNMVAHHYRRVDPSVLWDTIQNDLPPLAPMLREILEREASETVGPGRATDPVRRTRADATHPKSRLPSRPRRGSLVEADPFGYRETVDDANRRGGRR